MADFTSSFWNWYIIIPTVAGIIACFLLIRWLSTAIKPEDEGKEMDHVWDEDLVELNNPLPRWWLNMFYITLFFGIGYLVLYPGLGTFARVCWAGPQPGSTSRRWILPMRSTVRCFRKKYQAMDIVAVADDAECPPHG